MSGSWERDSFQFVKIETGSSETVASHLEFLHRSKPAAWKLFLLVALAGLCQFLIALTGFPDLMGNEHRIGAYALDAVRNGHWFVQQDFSGDVASKPPMLTWLVALGTFGSKEITRFALYWPTAVATIGIALILLAWGKRYFGREAGLLSALAYLFSWFGQSQMMTVRYDGLLALAVTLSALAAFRAWTLRRSWDWFWLAVAWGTLIKGPVALLLGTGGLMAIVWEKRTGHETTMRGPHWRGVLLFLVLCGGWFLLAYADMGQPLIQKMFDRELVGHLTGGGGKKTMLLGFYKPPMSFITAYAPWSLIVCAGIWRVWRQPAARAEERQLERFLTCWFVFGLLLFCVAAHQRGRLIMPLLPAAAMLAGRELARWPGRWPVPKIACGLTVVVLAGLLLYHHVWMAMSSRVQQTLAMRDMADTVRDTLGGQFPLVHVGASDADTSFTLQFYLNTASPLTSMERAVELLQGDYPAYAAIMNHDAWLRFETNLNVHEIARWPQTGIPSVIIVGNRPPSETATRLATIHGPLLIQMERMRLVKIRGQEFTFSATGETGKISIRNQSQEQQSVSIRALAADHRHGDLVAHRLLSPDEDWIVSPDNDKQTHSRN